MAPLIVQIVATLLARLRFRWVDANRIGLAAMFMFTATSHFSPLKYDMAAMIPPPLTGALWVIYITGILELAGAIGLMLTRWRTWAAWGLMSLLVAMLPANVYAALSGVTLQGNPAAALWWRVPLQLFWIGMLWWSSVKSREQGSGID
jgi:uncharacterized membrane protein